MFYEAVITDEAGKGRQRSVLCHFANCQTLRWDVWHLVAGDGIRPLQADEDVAEEQIAYYESNVGHLERDQRLVEKKIVASRGNKRRREFLIRWQGWSSQHDSWEPARNELVDSLLQDFDGAEGDATDDADHLQHQLGEAADARDDRPRGGARRDAEQEAEGVDIMKKRKRHARARAAGARAAELLGGRQDGVRGRHLQGHHPAR